MFALVGKFQRDLALAAAAHAVQEELAPPARTAVVDAKVRAEPLQDPAAAFEERRDGLAMVDRREVAVTPRSRLMAGGLACCARVVSRAKSRSIHFTALTANKDASPRCVEGIVGQLQAVVVGEVILRSVVGRRHGGKKLR